MVFFIRIVSEMCGINGRVSRIPLEVTEIQEKVQDMNQSIQHRGPDSDGVYTRMSDEYSLGVGQVRLSIIDLSAGGFQPMFYTRESGGFSEKFHQEVYDTQASTSISMVFNGEIYNYQQIKETLLELGYVFNSHSDTEVILAAYLEYGEYCVTQFNGMRSLVIHDPIKNILICSRDKLGQKPLYYYHDAENFIFSSELKGILQHTTLGIATPSNINTDAIDCYLTTGYIPAPLTIFQTVKKLEARHTMVIDLTDPGLEATISPYCDLPTYAPVYDKQLLLDQGRTLLEDAVKIRTLTADVPVGAFLSGGIDSSTTVALMKQYMPVENLHTFSVGFEGSYDESAYITMAKDAFGTQHHHTYYTEADFLSMIDTIHDHYDEPFADYSHFPVLFISQKAKEHLTVCISGDGGDEIFGGYTMHSVGWVMQCLYILPRMMRKLLWKMIPAWGSEIGLLRVAKELCRVSLYTPEEFHTQFLVGSKYIGPWYKAWSTQKMKTLLATNKGNFIQSMIDFDLLYHTLADNFLVKVDRASMATGLEVRSPFLDRRLVEYAHTIPTKRKVVYQNRKKLLKEMMSGILSSGILKRKKAGFEPPIDQWLTDDKYQNYTVNGVERLSQEGVLSDTQKTFFEQEVLNKDHKLARIYMIRYFLFIGWYDRWIDQ